MSVDCSLVKAAITPTINGSALSVYGADLLDDYSVGACEYSNGYMKPLDRAFPVKLRGKIGLRPITMTMDFSGETEAEAVGHISLLTASLMQQANLYLPDGFYYWAALDGVSAPKKVSPWIWQATFSFHGVRHGSMITTTCSTSGNITVQGNMVTPMIVKLTPASGATSMTFNGITINLGRIVTIDSVNTTVQDANGLNVYDYTNMTAWPKLTPGINAISLTGCTAEIKYYPIFL